MGFKQDLDEIDRTIGEEYEKLVIEHYAPVIEKVKGKLLDLMRSQKVPGVNLRIRDGLVFKNDGQFYRGENVRVIDLRHLAREYV